MPNKKKFIDKKNAVTYRLVPTETDPSQPNGPQHVLMPVSKEVKKIRDSLPASVFPSVDKKPVKDDRLYPSKGPRPDWDPDIVAALDDDFDYSNSENVLDDDFITKANDLSLSSEIKNVRDKNQIDQPSPDVDCDDSDHEYLDNNSEFSGDYSQFSDTNPKSRYTQYSLTSAVTNCTEDVKTFNERFEKVFETYDEDQIGALDCEEIGGHLTTESKRVQELIDSELPCDKQSVCLGLCDEEVRRQIIEYAEEDIEEKLIQIKTKKRSEWDCESFLSAYSNRYNQPGMIRLACSRGRIALKSEKKRLTKMYLKQLDKEAKINNSSDEDSEASELEDDRSEVTSCNIRLKDETPEEKRKRKRLFKDIKRENRAIKKENKIAFEDETKRQRKQAICARRNKRIRLL